MRSEKLNIFKFRDPQKLYFKAKKDHILGFLTFNYAFNNYLDTGPDLDGKTVLYLKYVQLMNPSKKD